jgi:hypothetical protein
VKVTKKFVVAIRGKDPEGVELAKLTEKLKLDYGIKVLGRGALAMTFEATDEDCASISKVYGHRVLLESPAWYVSANEAEALSGRSGPRRLEFDEYPLPTTP